MEKEKKISVWIGEGFNKKTFNKILEYNISENGLGEFVACEFCQKYKINSYDPDIFGGKFFSKKVSWKLLFHGIPFSNFQNVINSCGKLEPANCYVLLYDFEYNGQVYSSEIQGLHFTFLGNFDYYNLV